MTDYDPQHGRAMPPEPLLSPEQSEADDDDVAAAVRGLASLVSDVAVLEDVLVPIARFTVTSVPGAEGAGVTLVRADGAQTPAVLAWAATDAIVREIDHLQYEICHEGPCLSAMATRRGVVSGSVGSDRRWPRFGGRVARLEVHSTMALPLIMRGAVVGALNIYAHARDAFTEHALRLGEQFATPAGVAVGNIQLLHAAQARAAQLQTALSSRAVIDQAIGIVRSRSGGTEQEAFQRLRQISQSENVKLSLVAQRVVDEAVRRANARHASPGRT